jgi:predicted short-subunit dehydrogenase-like oxidoreductase (DUF2520 family)
MADSILIIGKGKVGSSIAQAIRARNREISDRGIGDRGVDKRMKLSGVFSGRTKRFPVIQSDVVIIATKDSAIADVAKKALASALKPPRIMVHLAGSLPSTVLPGRKGIERLTLHPIQTFSEPNGELLRGIYWMASGSTKAIYWAREFVTDIGSKGLIVLPAEALPLYHAMTVFSSNFITLLMGAVEEISEELGQNPKRMKSALRTLAETALQNALAEPASEVLTGPISRKDFETIEKHQRALKALDPKLKAIYDGFLSFALKSGTSKR